MPKMTLQDWADVTYCNDPLHINRFTGNSSNARLVVRQLVLHEPEFNPTVTDGTHRQQQPVRPEDATEIC